MVIKMISRNYTYFFKYMLITHILFLISLSSYSQVSEEEHQSHHPETYGQKENTSSKEPSIEKNKVVEEMEDMKKGQTETDVTDSMGGGKGGMMGGGKGGMMGGGNGGMMGGGNGGMMGGGKGPIKGGMMKGCPAGNCGKKSPLTWDIYPTLINLKELTDTKKSKIREAARERISNGKKLMEESLDELFQASKRTDYNEMENSLEEIRQGAGLYKSGLAANKALDEGKAPKNIALRWFKKEMNLLPMALQSSKADASILFGMSFFHTGIMGILVLFMIVMIWMYFFKMKRAASLLEEFAQNKTINNLSSKDQNKEDHEVNTAPIAKKVEIKKVEIKKEVIQENHLVRKKFVANSEKYKGKLKIIGIFSETPDVKTFRLALPDGKPLCFTYQPGQFVTFAFEFNGKKVKRSYTISSSPTDRDYIEVTIKREEKGLVSRHFHDTLELHDSIEVNIPNGNFHFNGEGHDSVVLISGGVGITPMMSTVRYLTAKCWPGEIYFLFCTRTSNDFIYQKELEYLQMRHSNLSVFASMTRAKGTSWMGSQGRFTKEQFSKIPDIISKQIHICGPPPMMEAVKAMLIDLGVPKENIKIEAFGGAKPKTSSENKPNTPRINNEEKAKTENNVNVSFTLSNKVVLSTPEKTILEAAEVLDIEIDNSCRAGSCGMCKVKLLSGEVSMEIEDSLEAEEKEQGIILACQAKTKKDASIEA